MISPLDIHLGGSNHLIAVLSLDGGVVLEVGALGVAEGQVDGPVWPGEAAAHDELILMMIVGFAPPGIVGQPFQRSEATGGWSPLNAALGIPSEEDPEHLSFREVKEPLTSGKMSIQFVIHFD